MGTGSLPGVKCGRGVLLTTHPLLVPRSWKSRAIRVPTLWATPGLYQNHFTFCIFICMYRVLFILTSLVPFLKWEQQSVFLSHALIESFSRLCRRNTKRVAWHADFTAFPIYCRRWLFFFFILEEIARNLSVAGDSLLVDRQTDNSLYETLLDLRNVL